jgi:ubiquinone/menaquinone biosynthesis C-methylase UbiE
MTHVELGNFDELADAYDRYRIGYANETYDALFEYGLTQGDTVLDVGSGTGLVAAELTARGCSVVGIDPSEPMLERARKRVPGARFVAGRAEALPVADASFDAATSAQSFHWFDQPLALAELKRVVRPGGTIAVWWKGLMRGDRLRMLREEAAAGLDVAPVRDLLVEEFAAFETSGLHDRRLRVIPWFVHMRVSDYLGYERSRARPREAYGERLQVYFERLATRLGPPESEISLAYLQLLYLGRVAAADAGAGA